MAKTQQQVAPFIKPEPKPRPAPKTYKRYRIVFGPLTEGDGATVRSELHRSAKDAQEEIVAGMFDRGILRLEEVTVVAKRETRYEEVERG